MTKKGNKSGSKDGKSKNGTKPLNDEPTTSLILRMKPVHPSECKVKVAFEDKDGEMIEEKVHMYWDGQHKEIVLTENNSSN